MGRLATLIWVIFFSMMLGWYSFIIIGVAFVLFVIGVLIKCWYDDRQFEKHRKERGL